MKLKKRFVVFFTVCALIFLSLPVGAADQPSTNPDPVDPSNFEGTNFFGMILRRCRSVNDTTTWSKRTLSNEQITSGIPIPSQMYMQTGFFFTSDF